jgi:hypothetical protein
MKMEITCPFCQEEGFDLIGLKYHLLNYCDAFDETVSANACSACGAPDETYPHHNCPALNRGP